jgi:hypothetical protein
VTFPARRALSRAGFAAGRGGVLFRQVRGTIMRPHRDCQRAEIESEIITIEEICCDLRQIYEKMTAVPSYTCSDLDHVAVIIELLRICAAKAKTIKKLSWAIRLLKMAFLLQTQCGFSCPSPGP